MKANQTVRGAAKRSGVKHWQIAMYIGVSENTLLRWLRAPLSAEREKTIMKAIDTIAREVA
ncbi:MAG: hypothetical protein J6K03_08040 [Oscillospiraceae bacterium]|nr:hypothetical protein [Oscillospiraceae bacterium]